MKTRLSTGLLAAFATMAAVVAQAGSTYTIPAPGGVGDVVALTNAFADLTAKAKANFDATDYSKIQLSPGVYDLRGIKMESGSHLALYAKRSTVVGLGEGPEDTVLLGGGETDKCRVLRYTGGGNYYGCTTKNLTVTGGYVSGGSGAGICNDSYSALCDHCIVSNNVEVSGSRSVGGGGGVAHGGAKDTLFANNTGSVMAGALFTGYSAAAGVIPTIRNCVFTNNVQAVAYGRYYGGGALNTFGPVIGCTFVDNRSVGYGGAIGSTDASGSPRCIVDCTFVGNTAPNGGALHQPKCVTNCVFVANRATSTDGGAVFQDSAYPSEFVGCSFTNNVAKDDGGAIYSENANATNLIVGCTFVGSTASGGGGGAINLRTASAAGTIADCTFTDSKSKGSGGAILGNGQSVTGCRFDGDCGGSGCAAAYANLSDCTVSGISTDSQLLYSCNLTDCFVTNNWSSTKSAIDAGGGTNVNCVIADNVISNATGNAYGHIVRGKWLVNCTLANNWSRDSGNYGGTFADCVYVNCLFAGNAVQSTRTAMDIRTSYKDATRTIIATNCLFTALPDTTLEAQPTAGCQLVPVDKVGFRAGGCEILGTSPAVDAGLDEDWVLGLTGATDLYGKERVYSLAIDIGASESNDRLGVLTGALSLYGETVEATAADEGIVREATGGVLIPYGTTLSLALKSSAGTASFAVELEGGASLTVTRGSSVQTVTESGTCLITADPSLAVTLTAVNGLAVVGTFEKQFVHTDSATGISWYYSVAGGLATVKTTSALSGCVTVPATLDGTPVGGLADGALRNQADLVTVTLPASLASVGASVFDGCAKLQIVAFSGSVPTGYGADVFAGANADLVVAHASGQTGWPSASPTLWNGHLTIATSDKAFVVPGGDVVSLTNAIGRINALGDEESLNSRLWLLPGLYDLRGTHMTGDSHLSVEHLRDFVMAALGKGPADTVLLGGGEAEQHRVMKLSGGGRYWWNTVSNLTVTGGWVAGPGGGIKSDSVATLYVDCIVSNNVSSSEDRWASGGGCANGCAVNCLFANNESWSAGGGLMTGGYKEGKNLWPYVRDCVFSNNVMHAGYYHNGGGGVCGGIVTRCRFYYNKAPRGGGGGQSESATSPVFIDCEFIGNEATSYGGGVQTGSPVSNCTFVANVAPEGGGAYVYPLTSDFQDAMGPETNIFVGCTFTANVATNVSNEGKGGAVYLRGGAITNCTFSNNVAGNAGGAVFVDHSQGARALYDSTFVANRLKIWGYGGGICSQLTGEKMTVGQAIGCRFLGAHGGACGAVAYGMTLRDCTVTGFNSDNSVFRDCHLYGSFVTNNVYRGTTALDDRYAVVGALMNVHCLFADNVVSNANGVAYDLCEGKTLVNCTIANNWMKSAGNYGGLVKGTLVNCLLAGNLFWDNRQKLDHRTKYLGSEQRLVATNCVFEVLDTTLANEPKALNCMVGKARFKGTPEAPYAIGFRSAARNAGLSAPAILSVLGDRDLYGQPRVQEGCIDAGVSECPPWPWGFKVLVR